LRVFAEDMRALQDTLDFHMSARGWCYHFENLGHLRKSDFNWAQEQINEARLQGLLRPGFILEEEGHEVEEEYDFDIEPEDHFGTALDTYEGAEETFRDSWMEFDEVSFWDDQECFIQLLVEKSDLKSLFRVICEKYHINMANLRGWGSYEQKAVMARMFRTMERKGKTPVLFECGDHDPPGLAIANTLRDHFKNYELFTGWDPKNLVVDRIGLTYEFIQENGLSWIDGLVTASDQDLADPKHKMYKANTYNIQGYIEEYGARKVEANALVVVPDEGRQMLEDAILGYVGDNAYEVWQEKIVGKRGEIRELIESHMKSGDGEDIED